MNVWRWLGFFFFLTAATCFVGVQLPALAGEKDKAKDKDKAGEKKEEKKQEEKKGEKASSGELKFKAFEGKDPFFQEVSTNTEQFMKVMGQEVKQVQDQIFYIKW